MNPEEFLLQLEELLQTDVSLKLDTNLASLEEWDSLSMMTVATFFNKKFAKKLSYIDIKKLNTPADIFAKMNE